MANTRQQQAEGVASASMRYVRMSPRKARLVMNLVRGRQVGQALQILDFNPQKGAKAISKLLRSAIFNAKEKGTADVDQLWVTGGWVDRAGFIKRFLPRSRGSASDLKKPFAHITVVVGEKR